jgi:allantoinase
MSRLDLIVRNGTLVTPLGLVEADIQVAEGRIIAVGHGPSDDARETIDAAGLHIFPGLIDSHVHFNEPGRTEWEGIRTGSQALAAGGGTMFFDMPLNSHPPTLDSSSFDLKLAEASANSLTDFGLWGGLVPGNLDRLPELADRGVVGFKAFMCDSGIDDFARADEKTLRAGMKRAATLRRLVAVHAESQELVAAKARDAIARQGLSARDFLDSRPIQAELDAIRLALDLAGETGCSLHVVHVTNAECVALIAEAARRGVDATCETCPHYLSLTDEDVLRLGAVAKCAPPLRPKSIQDELWNSVSMGLVTTLGSDHSPSPPSMKTGENFFEIWGGISGIQHTLPLLITEGSKHPKFALSSIAALASANVAHRFRLPKSKGRIEPGADADLALVDLDHSFSVEEGDLLYRHRQTPYLGRRLTGRVVRTILRGRTIFLDGRIVSQPTGQFIRPLQDSSRMPD